MAFMETDAGKALLRLLSRGHAVVAELQRTKEACDAAALGEPRLRAVLPDFVVFRTEGAIDRVANTPEKMEMDEESRELNQEPAQRIFRVLAAIKKYAADLVRLLDDLDAGAFVGQSLEGTLRDPQGVLLPEAVALLGTMLLILEEGLPGEMRERALVLFYRCTVGTCEEPEDFAEVCRLFKSTGRHEDLSNRKPGYPENYFARFVLPKEALRLVIGKLQTGDLYEASRHYPLPEHRSHGLSSQAGLLYVCLFFEPKTLESDFMAMREIVDRYFGDSWVVAYALGFTADLLQMWAPYPAAKQALGHAVTTSNVRQLQERHMERLADAQAKLKDCLMEGVLTEDYVSSKTSQLLSLFREANTSIRWLLLQPTTKDPKLESVCRSSARMREEVLGALVDTALLEEKVKGILIPLVSNREADWARLKEEAALSMDDLALFFSGEHALKRKVRNEELEEFFRSLQQRIEELSLSQEDFSSLGRKVAQVDKALNEVALFHEVSQQPQILHFLSDARQLLQRMLRTANLNEEMLSTIETVADLSYAWHALAGYKEAMGNLFSSSPDSIKGLRALFLKLASILEVPLRRIRQSGNESHAALVSEYYSAGLVRFMRSVLQDIPRLIFQLLAQLARLSKSSTPNWPSSRVAFAELQNYAQRSEGANLEVGQLTRRIALLMRGIRETDVAYLGAILVEPKEVLGDGLRRELAQQIETMLAKTSFEPLEASLKDLAEQSLRLRSSFEHVQDYLGVSAQELWRSQFSRVVRFLLHMEQQQLLGRRKGAKASPDHDPTQPIRFPDALGGSFLSRGVTKLLDATEPSKCSGGFRQDWSSNLDSLVLHRLMEAVGAPGVAAMSQLLAFRAAMRVRKALEGCRTLLADDHAQLVLKAARSRSYEALRPASAAVAPLVVKLATMLCGLGQIALLRRRLSALLRLHGTLDAPLISKSLAVLDETALAEILEDADESAEVDGPLPSLWDFVDSSGMAQEGQLRFRRQLAKTGELHGFGEPLRQLLQVLPEDSSPNGLDALLALSLVQYAAERPRSTASKKEVKRASTWTASRPASSPAVQSWDGEGHVALSAGLASFLQQLPRRQLHGMFDLCGVYIQGLCREEAWAEGATMIQVLQQCLELLGFPREHLADFVPHGLLDLWPD